MFVKVIRDKEENKKYRRQVSLSVLLLFIFGAVINIPFSREVKRLGIEAGRKDIHLYESIFNDLITIGFSSFIVGGIVVFVGLWVSSNANLGAPAMARLFSRKPINELINRDVILLSILLSATIALLLLGLFEIQKEIHPVSHKLMRPAKPFYFLVAFSAGITEEIIFRLGLMSLIVTVVHFFRKEEEPSSTVVWVSIIVSALFFGLAHLPLAKNFADPTPFTIGVTMIGNLVTGTMFGLIFWKRGLLVAILSHVVFDLVFHVIGTPYV